MIYLIYIHFIQFFIVYIVDRSINYNFYDQSSYKHLPDFETFVKSQKLKKKGSLIHTKWNTLTFFIY